MAVLTAAGMAGVAAGVVALADAGDALATAEAGGPAAADFVAASGVPPAAALLAGVAALVVEEVDLVPAAEELEAGLATAAAAGSAAILAPAGEGVIPPAGPAEFWSRLGAVLGVAFLAYWLGFGLILNRLLETC
jgi:hypothetical protein